MRYILWAHFVRFMDTRLIRTPQYYGQFVLSLRKEIRPLQFYKFSNLSMLPSVSVLIGFNCAVKPTLRTTENTDPSLLRTAYFAPWEGKPYSNAPSHVTRKCRQFKNTDFSLLQSVCPTFSLNSITRLIRTPREYGHFLRPPQCPY